MDANFRHIATTHHETNLPTEGCELDLSPKSPTSPANAVVKPKKKPCCVCKMSKKLRDNCIRNNNEEVCFSFIEAHKYCLRMKGFKVD
jgi:hypothetical protein